jgi:hypothetical protein
MMDLEFIFLGKRFELKTLAGALAALRETADQVRKSPAVYDRYPPRANV